MKRKHAILLLSSLLVSLTTMGQSKQGATDKAPDKSTKTETQPIYTYVEQMPEPSVNISDCFRNVIIYPAEAQADSAEGRVVVTFVIDSSGAVRDAVVTKAAHPALNAEALRVVRMMPKWVPGRQNGKAVNVYFSLPVSFKLK